MKVVIFDNGAKNIAAMRDTLQALAPEAKVLVSCQLPDIRCADRIILPGETALLSYLAPLNRDPSFKAMLIKALSTRPSLAISVGMHLLFDSSEEAQACETFDGEDIACLGLIPGMVVKFSTNASPQTKNLQCYAGWRQIRQFNPHPLWQGISENSHFYFSHRFVCLPQNPQDSAALADYGGLFCAAVTCANIFATQFYPEKSGMAGLRLCRNFMEWKP